MPFWPWYMLACAVLIYVGRRDGAWIAPALILGGLIAMRGVVTYTDGPWQQVAACAVWLSVAALLAYKGLWLVAVLCATSGIVYPALMLFGLRIEYLGPVAILADVFLIAGMVAAHFGGGGGVAADPRGRALGGVAVLVDRPGGVAAPQARASQDPRSH